MPFGISEHIKRIKIFIMATVGSLILIAALCGSLIPILIAQHGRAPVQTPRRHIFDELMEKPEHPVIQRNLDRYHPQINYGDTYPALSRHSGIKSAVSMGNYDGWINPGRNERIRNNVYHSRFII